MCPSLPSLSFCRLPTRWQPPLTLLSLVRAVYITRTCFETHWPRMRPGGRAARSVLHATRGDVRRCSLLCLWKHCLVWEASPDIIRVHRAGPGLRLTQWVRIFCRNDPRFCPGLCWSDWEGSLFNMTQNAWDYSWVSVLLCIYRWQIFISQCFSSF